ncbi:hypothetical protein [Paraglaciecola sp. L3A3]|uniref:hypothetical protein n=1 Tax=Paraglaciecola sp. L3A3 TaxID=2686358 RepID=UPI00131E95A9|nr:hypothetical protein [Paraglaciecola sp. L3A3]
MKIKYFFCCLLPIFSGCELLPKAKADLPSNPHKELLSQPICIWAAEEAGDCQVEYWLRYWANIETISWLQRKKQIENLSESDEDLLRKIILCQGKGTPYQSRLRAQIWAETIMPKLSPDMRMFLKVALYQPSLEMLEMESALVTLSKTNSRNQKLVEQQQQQINKQNNQIDQLLKIETSIMSSGQRNN